MNNQFNEKSLKANRWTSMSLNFLMGKSNQPVLRFESVEAFSGKSIDQNSRLLRAEDNPKAQGSAFPYSSQTYYHGGNQMLNLTVAPAPENGAALVKRIFDIAFSVSVMLLGLPIFLIIMLLVKCSSRGPVFFLQKRTGRWGAPFHIIKFRTMYTDSKKYNLTHSLGASDPRITRIGRFLRRTRLDELPQFLNVLKGEMSVVGPRPLHKVDVDMLMEQASHDFQRLLTIRPGITSIGQIKVGYATNAAENLKRLKYDIIYLDIYGMTTDLYLIWMTILVVLNGKGR